MLFNPVRDLCALRYCMNIFFPKIGVAHHAICGIIFFVSFVLTHTLPDNFQGFFTDISKG